MFDLKTKELGSFDVIVCGGGIAGTGAAVSAAKAGACVCLIEADGCLGGTMTACFMPHILDADNKGGIIRELFDFLNAHGMTCARRGPKTDASGKRIPGRLIDTEGAKYYFDRICRDAGVRVLFHSRVTAAEQDGDRIRRVLLSTECGNYTASAPIFIDASGSGALAALAGCAWDCGDPQEKRPSPASMSVCAGGFPEDYNGTDSADEKTRYAEMLQRSGIEISAGQGSVVKLPSLHTWSVGINFEYDVNPDDIASLSEASQDSRREAFEVIEAHKRIPGYEGLYTVFTGPRLGLREGRRVYGLYRICNDDILSGRRFEDGICLVTAGVDVHKLKPDDTLDYSRGYRSKPYHIPFGSLVARDCANLLLAGRCLSGDFYPHASYRMMGNMAATGEAAGFAAAACAAEGTLPRDFDGKRAKAFMESRDYQL